MGQGPDWLNQGVQNLQAQQDTLLQQQQAQQAALLRQQAQQAAKETQRIQTEVDTYFGPMVDNLWRLAHINDVVTSIPPQLGWDPRETVVLESPARAVINDVNGKQVGGVEKSITVSRDCPKSESSGGESITTGIVGSGESAQPTGYTTSVSTSWYMGREYIKVVIAYNYDSFKGKPYDQIPLVLSGEADLLESDPRVDPKRKPWPVIINGVDIDFINYLRNQLGRIYYGKRYGAWKIFPDISTTLNASPTVVEQQLRESLVQAYAHDLIWNTTSSVRRNQQSYYDFLMSQQQAANRQTARQPQKPWWRRILGN